MRFRIGIHSGEVAVDGGDLLGAGVNLAARLQFMAEPGGIFISRPVYEQVVSKLPVPFDDLGVRRPKNCDRDIEIYRVRTGHERTASGEPAKDRQVNGKEMSPEGRIDGFVLTA